MTSLKSSPYDLVYRRIKDLVRFDLLKQLLSPLRLEAQLLLALSSHTVSSFGIPQQLPCQLPEMTLSILLTYSPFLPRLIPFASDIRQ